MGRQIIFHMLAEDRTAFLSFVQKRDSVVITDFTGLCEGPDYAQELLKRPTGLLWFRRMLCIIRPRSEGI